MSVNNKIRRRGRRNSDIHNVIGGKRKRKIRAKVDGHGDRQLWRKRRKKKK